MTTSPKKERGWDRLSTTRPFKADKMTLPAAELHPDQRHRHSGEFLRVAARLQLHQCPASFTRFHHLKFQQIDPSREADGQVDTSAIGRIL